MTGVEFKKDSRKANEDHLSDREGSGEILEDATQMPDPERFKRVKQMNKEWSSKDIKIFTKAYSTIPQNTSNMKAGENRDSKI